MGPEGKHMRRISLVSCLVIALAWVACQDDSPIMPPDDNGGPPPIDLTSFNGCWHVTGTPFQRFGPEVCRAALDSVLELLTVSADDSLFATIDDTASHLTFVAPYRGTGDFAGTTIEGDNGQVIATYLDDAGACLLATKISGPIFAQNGGSEFFADYSVIVHFDGGDSCETDDCKATFTFEGVRRPDGRCANP